MYSETPGGAEKKSDKNREKATNMHSYALI